MPGGSVLFFSGVQKLEPCGHHQSGFAGLVHAAEPAGVKLVPQLLFTDAIVFPDLHRFAAARARIATAGDNVGLLSLPFPAQIARPIKIRTPANCERSRDQAIWKRELKFRRNVAICWHIAVDFKTDADFNQNWGLQAMLSSLLMFPKRIAWQASEQQYRTICGDLARRIAVSIAKLR